MYHDEVMRMDFKVHRVSSEDPDYCAHELEPGPEGMASKGWQSARYCAYPQSIEFKLPCQANLQRIQILSHQTKIPSKAELYVSALPPGEVDAGNAIEERLGFFPFNTNESTGFQKRELKTIDMHNRKALFVRLVLHQNHVNDLNIYNQVAIVAVALIGGQLGWRQGRAGQARALDMQLELLLDSRSLARVRELEALKARAVAEEDYDRAKEIKASVQRVMQLGQKAAQLEALKNAAAEREDYDEAKRLKVQLDQLRLAGDGLAVSPAIGEPRNGGKDPDEIFSRVVGRAASPRVVEAALAPPSGAAGPQDLSTSGRDSHGMEAVLTTAREPSFGRGAYAEYEATPVRGVGSGGGEVPLSMRASTATEHAPDGGHVASEPSTAPPSDLNIALDEGQVAPDPPKVATADAGDADVACQLCGEYIARCMFSRQWQQRALALRYMARRVESRTLSDYRALAKFIVRGLRDKVPAAVTEAAALFKAAVAAAGKAAPSVVSPCVPTIAERLGDGAARVVDVCKDLVVFLSSAHPAELVHISSQLFKPPKRAAAWKPLLTQLTLLEELIPVLHVGKDKAALPLAEVMLLVGAGATNANGTARAAAIRVAALALQEAGPDALTLLPGTVNPKVREAMCDAAGLDANTASAPRGKVSRQSPAAAAPKAAVPRQAPAARRTSAGTKRGAATPAAAPAAVAEETPEWYIREAARKQREQGAAAAQDATIGDCLSHAAIIYTQRGDAEKALPLFERALAIFEQTRGPRSQDVAHLLTDLAVVHLEAGREAVGRPLLERAFDIQRERLGDDNPDVLAIKEVLADGQ